jgi:methyl-accepting chemotaxis protein
MKRSTSLTWIAGALILVSVVAAWVAIGRLAAATEQGLARTEESLESARKLAADTAASAKELERVVGVVGEGLASTGEALVATRQVSGNVRGLLDVVSFVGRVDELSKSLKDAEASIANVEATLAEASASVEEAGPVLDQAVTSLEAIPNQIRDSISDVRASRTRIVQQVWLWRLAIAAAGAALLVILLLLSELRRATRTFVN